MDCYQKSVNRSMAKGVVGALSLNSPDFVVPLLIKNKLDLTSIDVIVSAFHEQVERTGEKPGALTSSRHYSLPLPIVKNYKGEQGQQIYVSIDVSSKNKLLAAVRAWVKKYSAVVRKKGEYELAASILLNGEEIVHRISQDDTVIRDRNDSVAMVLKHLYGYLGVIDYVNIRIVKREMVLPLIKPPKEREQSQNDTINYIFSVFDLLAEPQIKSLVFKQRGVLKIGRGKKAFTVKHVIRSESGDEYTCSCSEGRIFLIKRDNSSLRLLLKSGNSWLNTKGYIALYGSLTMLRLVEFGTVFYVPWYAEFSSKKDMNGGYKIALPAVEFISPSFPHSINRLPFLVGGGERLSPSGAYLYDYKGENIKSFISCILRTNRSSAGWIYNLIANCGRGGQLSVKRKSMWARWCVARITLAFAEAIEKGKLVETISLLQNDVSVESKIIKTFKILAFIRLYRKHHYYQSLCTPKTSYINALRNIILADNDIISRQLICGLLSQAFDALNGVSDALLSKQQGKLLASNKVPEIEKIELGDSEYRKVKGIFFSQLNQREWYYLRIVERKLEHALIQITMAIWTLSSNMFNVNLPTLALLRDQVGDNAVTLYPKHAFVNKTKGYIIFQSKEKV